MSHFPQAAQRCRILSLLSLRVEREQNGERVPLSHTMGFLMRIPLNKPSSPQCPSVSSSQLEPLYRVNSCKMVRQDSPARAQYQNQTSRYILSVCQDRDALSPL